MALLGSIINTTDLNGTPLGQTNNLSIVEGQSLGSITNTINVGLDSLTEIPWEFTSSPTHHVARIGTPVEITLLISNDYNIIWSILESESIARDEEGDITGDVVASGTGNIISFTFTEDHFLKSYDVIVTAQTEGLQRHLGRRTIRCVLDEIYSESDPDVTVYNLASASGFYTSPPANTKVIFKGVRTSGSMYINNWANVRIQVHTTSGQPAKLSGSDCRLRIGSGNSGIVIDACCDESVQYGFEVNPSNGVDCVEISPGALSTTFTENVTMCGIYAYGNGTYTSGATTGFHISAYDQGADPGQGSLLGGPHIFNVRSGLVVNENLYLGWTRDYENRTRQNNPRYHHIVLDACGWDHFQPGNSIGVEAHDIYMNDGSGQLNNSNQFSTMSLNGISGMIHHCYFGGGHKGFTGSTGRYHGQKVELFYNTITSKPHDYGESLAYNWYRLGDGAYYPTTEAKLWIYNNIIETDTYPIGLYTNGAGAEDTLSFAWVDNTTPDTAYTGNPSPTGSFVVAPSDFEKHWLTDFDKDGYRTVVVDTLFHALYNLGGDGTDPAVANTISVWDLTKSTSNENYGVLGGNGVTVIAVNGSGGGPPTLSAGQYWGWKSGNTAKAFNMTVTGSNLYLNDVLDCSWFLDNTPAGIRFEGLPNGTYTVKIITLLTGDATTRTGRFNINGGSNIDVQCNNPATNNVLTSEASHMAIESGIVVSDGIISILASVVTGQFVHVNGIEIIQTA